VVEQAEKTLEENGLRGFVEDRIGKTAEERIRSR
jgi:hypothetical protein